ncbi:MAG: ferrous iron transport protein A [Anaerolineae bacterium]|nr:ferrous iron transport protein A [Anaerolineae bacterium]
MSQNDTNTAHTLADLHPGETGTVSALHSQGPERRRMMDLGIIPGTTISVEMNSPLGDPVAYRVRDTLVALRREQAQLILIDKTTAKTTTEETS